MMHFDFSCRHRLGPFQLTDQFFPESKPGPQGQLPSPASRARPGERGRNRPQKLQGSAGMHIIQADGVEQKEESA